MNKFKGTGVAIVTPFNEDKSVDYQSLERLIHHLTSNGVDYLVVQGTTGESVTLSTAEKKEVLDFVIKINQGKLPIVYGIGGNNTMALIEAIKNTNLDGVDAILSVSPYYNKPTQEGIYQHYKAIAEVSPIPIILYNVPARTGSHMEAETVLRLANDFKNIIGVKEASGVMFHAMKIIKNKPKDFLVISGDDILNLPILSCGGDGVISVVANAFPKGYSSMVKAALTGNCEEARAQHYKYLDIIHFFFVEGNPAGVKAALKILGICNDVVRLPLITVSKSTYQEIEKQISSY